MATSPGFATRFEEAQAMRMQSLIIAAAVVAAEIGVVLFLVRALNVPLHAYDALAGARRIIVLPDGPLHDVPFELPCALLQ